MSRKHAVTRNAFRVLLVLWAGSLWSLVWVAPTLFRAQSDRHLAGVLAGRLFSVETYLGVAVARARAAAAGQKQIPQGLPGRGAARDQRMGAEADSWTWRARAAPPMA